MTDDPLFDDILEEPRPEEPSGKDGRRRRPGRALMRAAGRALAWPFRRRGNREAVAARPPGRFRALKRVAGALLVVILLYYPVGMMLMHRIGDDTAFSVTVQKGESHAVAMTAALIGREVDTHRWLANDPFFVPSWALDNGPNFQVGIVAALSRFAIEMSDHVGRTRGSSTVDKDLNKAAGLLKYPGTVWIFDFSTSIAPTATSEAQYRAARRALLSYNKRLAAGQAIFDRRADNLQTTIDRINADLGSQSSVIEKRVRDHGGMFFDSKSDDIYYTTKGKLYAYYLILRELGKDFEPVIEERKLAPIWQQMLTSLREAAELHPLIVRNGKPDGMLMPSHLAAQGFYLLRTRTQLKEISNILLK